MCILFQSISNENWNGAPRGYKIEYRIWSLEPEDAGIVTVQQPSWNLINLENGTNVDSYILQGLQEWMDYQIRMISYNDVGSSPYSATIVARTLESSELILLPLFLSFTDLKKTIHFLYLIRLRQLAQLK